uniref:Protein kinase domain-containing protein n=1 Tax=Ascaris lumbricoides TaxID=6252 RepID=A0A9J2P300_ASCLU
MRYSFKDAILANLQKETRSKKGNAVTLRQQSNVSLVPCRPASSPPPPASTPLDKHYHHFSFRTIAGHWKLFSARSVLGDKEASVFIFEKKSNVKAPPRIGRINRLTLVDLIKYDVTQLTSLAHPRILHVLHPLDENKYCLLHRLPLTIAKLSPHGEMLAFATERVYASLETIVLEGGIDKLEMKLGVLQIIDGLSYLHNSVKMLHGNLTPSAIYVTTSRLWKIAGFAFSVSAKEPGVFPCFPWTRKLPAHLQPDLDFLAPEYLAPNQHTVTPAADVFSLGVLICWICAGLNSSSVLSNTLQAVQPISCSKNSDKLVRCELLSVLWPQMRPHSIRREGRGNKRSGCNLLGPEMFVEQIDRQTCLDTALQCIAEELGVNLLDAMQKVLSPIVEQRPSVQLLALIKHFDDPALSALRQLDDIAQEFDPAHKGLFLSQTLYNNLPAIPENLWFTRVLQRFNEHLLDSHELYAAIARPLFYMLDHCESHNIHKLRPWIRRIVDHAQQKALTPLILENMAVLLRRLSDDKVDDQLQDLLVMCIKSDDIHTQSADLNGLFDYRQAICSSGESSVVCLCGFSFQGQAVRNIPAVVEFLPNWFLARRLLPAFDSLTKYVQGNVSRQLDVLACIGALSDRCDWNTLKVLIPCVSICNMHHHAVIHAKSRLVQRIITCDASRLRDRSLICVHLLNPLTLGLALKELSVTHFDDVISTVRILIDMVEQLRYETDEYQQGLSCNLGRMGSRRVSMSSSHLPRVMITAARPSFSGYDSRKMSFLSADGRLEDRGRRESKDSRGSLESDLSSRIGNGSDVSDEHNPSGREGRRKSWLEGYMHSCSLEQNSSQLETTSVVDRWRNLGLKSTHPTVVCSSAQRNSTRRSERRARTRSPASDSAEKRSQPTRPNSFTNLGHNLVSVYIMENLLLKLLLRTEEIFDCVPDLKNFLCPKILMKYANSVVSCSVVVDCIHDDVMA